MACERVFANREAERIRLMNELEAQIASGAVALVQGLNGLSIEGADLKGLSDECVLAWVAAHGGVEARIALEAAGGDVRALAAIHGGHHA
ncbi:MAG: hypothetical protein AABY46_03965 [Nitrospirota bacterium]